MKTGMLKLILSMTVLMVLAACSPSSSNQAAQTLQNTDTTDSNSIIGGADSTAEFQKANGILGLLMIYETARGQAASTCTASAITSKIAVTAAHCLVLPRGSKLVAALVVLSPDFSKVIEEVNNDNLTNVRIVTQVKRHQNYLNGRGTNNDIGLIGFDQDLPADFNVIPLADAQLARTLRKGTTVTLAGFGVDKYELAKNPVTGRLSAEGSGDGLLRQIDGIRILSLTTTGEEITLDQSQGRGACHGDSGGPAFIKDPTTGKNILVGVTSRGTEPNGLCNREAIYTGIMGYTQWIQDGIKELSAPVVAPKASQNQAALVK